MNKVQFEIECAIRQANTGPTILRQACIICKHYLNDWDLKSKKAVCWYCRKKFFPVPQREKKQPVKDGLYAIAVD
jgi:hypothetical protein